MKHFITKDVKNGHTYLRMQTEGATAEQIRAWLIGDTIISAYIFLKDDLSSFWKMLIALGSGNMLELSGSETEIFDWNEYGTINIAFLENKKEIDFSIYKEIDVNGFSIVSAEKLIYSNGEISTECGFSLSSSNGAKFRVASGELPFRLSASTHSEGDNFCPRYDLDVCALISSGW